MRTVLDEAPRSGDLDRQLCGFGTRSFESCWLVGKESGLTGRAKLALGFSCAGEKHTDSRYKPQRAERDTFAPLTQLFVEGTVQTHSFSLSLFYE